MISSFLSSLYILEISPLLDVKFVKGFTHSIGCHFVLLVVSFALQKLCSFMRSQLLSCVLSACTICVLFRKLFSNKSHIVLALKSRRVCQWNLIEDPDVNSHIMDN